MSNYPPGVTGFEPQIAGPEDEYDTTRSIRVEVYCESAPEGYIDVTGVAVQWDRYVEDFTWECEYCKGEHTESRDPSED